jgi:CDP-diacylglycerol--glycerol-3-phosphate 3-phosphatidyltransferase
MLVTLTHSAYVLLWVATGLALWSLAIYMSNVWTHFVYPQAKHQ